MTILPMFDDVLVVKIRLMPTRRGDPVLDAWMVLRQARHVSSHLDEATAVEAGSALAKQHRVACWLSSDAGLSTVV